MENCSIKVIVWISQEGTNEENSFGKKKKVLLIWSIKNAWSAELKFGGNTIWVELGPH